MSVSAVPQEPMSLEQVLAKLFQLEGLTPARELTCKVSEKGAVSVYGMGRFPVTLYYEQWMTLLHKDNIARIYAFLKTNQERLKMKGDKIHD